MLVLTLLTWGNKRKRPSTKITTIYEAFSPERSRARLRRHILPIMEMSSPKKKRQSSCRRRSSSSGDSSESNSTNLLTFSKCRRTSFSDRPLRFSVGLETPSNTLPNPDLHRAHPPEKRCRARPLRLAPLDYILPKGKELRSLSSKRSSKDAVSQNLAGNTIEDRERWERCELLLETLTYTGI